MEYIIKTMQMCLREAQQQDALLVVGVQVVMAIPTDD